MNYEQRYKRIKDYCERKGFHIPISVDPYTQEEYETRQMLPELYWSERDYEAIEFEKTGKHIFCEKCI